MLQIFAAGNVGNDAELKYTPSGSPVCSFDLAVRVPQKGGEYGAQWVKCTVWGKSGEAAAKHIKKGAGIVVTGRPKIEAWNHRDTGELQTKLNIQVDRWQFVSGGQRQDDAAEREPDEPRRRPEQPPAPLPDDKDAPPIDLDEDVDFF